MTGPINADQTSRITPPQQFLWHFFISYFYFFEENFIAAGYVKYEQNSYNALNTCFLFVK